jgi:hypothetical protein
VLSAFPRASRNALRRGADRAQSMPIMNVTAGATCVGRRF